MSRYFSICSILVLIPISSAHLNFNSYVRINNNFLHERNLNEKC